MKKEKIKAIIGTLLLTGTFVGGYIAATNIDFAAASDSQELPVFDASRIEVALDNMQLTVFYYSEVGRSDRAPELEASHLSIEEVATKIAEAIDDEFNVSLDGLAIRINFVHEPNGNKGAWNAFVLADETDEGKELFQLTIDAKTGEILSEITDLVENPRWNDEQNEELGEGFEAEEEWLASLTAEELEIHEEAIRLTTPMDHHLSEEEASAIAIEWIYEEFGIVVDTETELEYRDFGMWFTHEDMNGERSFWTASFMELGGFNAELGGFEGGDTIIYHYIDLSIDGITGERVIIQDVLNFEPTVTEITLDNMQFLVRDATGLGDATNPAFIVEPQPYHLLAEEAATVMAEAIYEQFGDSLDGLTLSIGLRTFSGDLYDTQVWDGSVVNEQTDEIFLITIDARTGELMNILNGIEHSLNGGGPVEGRAPANFGGQRGPEPELSY